MAAHGNSTPDGALKSFEMVILFSSAILDSLIKRAFIGSDIQQYELCV